MKAIERVWWAHATKNKPREKQTKRRRETYGRLLRARQVAAAHTLTPSLRSYWLTISRTMLDLCREPSNVALSQTVYHVVLRPASCNIKQERKHKQEVHDLSFILFVSLVSAFICDSCLQRQKKALEANEALTSDLMESRLLRQRCLNAFAPRCCLKGIISTFLVNLMVKVSMNVDESFIATLDVNKQAVTVEMKQQTFLTRNMKSSGEYLTDQVAIAKSRTNPI